MGKVTEDSLSARPGRRGARTSLRPALLAVGPRPRRQNAYVFGVCRCQSNRVSHIGVPIAQDGTWPALRPLPVPLPVMQTLIVRLLGRFELEYGDRRAWSLGPAKADELCAYLLLRRKACPRDSPAGALWEGCTRDQARAYLRRALWQLQSGLRDKLGADAAGVFDVQPEWLARVPGGPLALDTDAVGQAYAVLLDAAGPTLTPPEVATAEAAVAGYRGDLLEASDAPWLVVHRERYRHQHLALREALAGHYLATDRPEHAHAHAERLVAHDVIRERSHRLLMEVLWRMGDRSAALRQYAVCAEALDREIGVAPLPETAALRQRILDGAAPEAGPRPAPTRAVARVAGPADATAEPIERALGLMAEAAACLRTEAGRRRAR